MRSTYITTGVAVNAVCLAVVGSLQVWSNLTGQNAIAARSQGLVQIAQQVKADTCWKIDVNEKARIGDIIDVGDSESKSPTSCFFLSKVGQFAYVRYLNGQLTVQQVYSRLEVRNQLSLLKREAR
jgi:hypothetical protein